MFEVSVASVRCLFSSSFRLPLRFVDEVFECLATMKSRMGFLLARGGYVWKTRDPSTENPPFPTEIGRPFVLVCLEPPFSGWIKGTPKRNMWAQIPIFTRPLIWV